MVIYFSMYTELVLYVIHNNLDWTEALEGTTIQIYQGRV